MCGMKTETLLTLSVLAAVATVCAGSSNDGALPSGVVNVAEFAASDGSVDVADGCGYLRDPRIDLGLVRKDDTVYKDYLQGVIHAP